MENKAVFLDRDGVINVSNVIDGKPFAPTRIEDFKIYEDAVTAVNLLKQSGFLTFVVTNQPDVGNGKVLKQTVTSMHEILASQLPLDNIYVCFHSQSEGCGCRKPNPGMLLQAKIEFGINLKNSFLIGDRKSDIDAGKAVGSGTIFIERGYSELSPEDPDYVCNSLSEAVAYILTTTTSALSVEETHERRQ